MTIWEKAILNMQKGNGKIAAAAATLSERVKAELALVRLRIRIDEVQARIDDLHRLIGRTIVDLKKQETLPKATEQLLKVDEIVKAMAGLTDREREIEELKMEMKSIQTDFKATAKQAEDTLA
jgi:predicted  nucleic acid-binding Zn-ribbon protein